MDSHSYLAGKTDGLQKMAAIVLLSVATHP